MAVTNDKKTQEILFSPKKAIGMLFLVLFLLLVATGFFISSGYAYSHNSVASSGWLGGIGGGFVAFAFLLIFGFFIVNPNESRVLVLFGKYRGTVRSNGFFWTNPFTMKHRVSLRIRNYDGEKLKVNDNSGSPIEISAVVVWKVKNTAEALFDVDDYVHFVKVQSESALRHLASLYPYDSVDEAIESLRGNTDEVSAELKKKLDERLESAGVDVIEARLNHLAYAPEIASAMLQRQQADAIIAARQKIVDGAVGMVEMALKKLKDDNILELDDERKAAMVSNLLVVLCSEHSTTPVVNTGSLYT